MNLSFDTPEYGWLELRLSDSKQEHFFDVSDVPCNSLLSFTSAVANLSEHSLEEEVEWSLEPSYLLWKLKILDSSIHLDIFLEDKLVATYLGPKAATIKNFYRSLLTLKNDSAWSKVDALESVWSWRFPSEELVRLKKLIDT